MSINEKDKKLSESQKIIMEAIEDAKNESKCCEE